MKLKIKTSLCLSLLSVGLCGCIAHKSVVYHDVERAKIEFESDAAARLFYETLSKRSESNRHEETTTTISIPIIFQSEEKALPGANVKFNDAVAVCDANKDGRITELEARIFANQR
ncbi:MAG: hypothetical protein RLZZ350_1365 [Verrucomicrobiota bacterium]|jgi:hypothetical protein